jgi:hypothetical protein
MQRLRKLTERIWPEPEPKPRWDLVALALAAGILIGLLTQNLGMLGYDWLTMFHANTATDIYYPPWTSQVLWPLAALPWRLGLALINGITIAAVALVTYQAGAENNRGWRLAAAFMALFSFQTMLVLWTGHIDGLALLAILGLPWLAPIVLMKATFIGFAVITRKSWLLAALVFGVLSLLIWPGWPMDLVATLPFRNTHPSAAGWAKTGWLPPLLGAWLLLNSKRTDWLQNVAAGSLLYPFLLPYHYVVLLPALGTLSGVALFAVWGSSWLMAIPGGTDRYFLLYFLFPILIWILRRRANHGNQSWLELLRSKS